MKKKAPRVNMAKASTPTTENPVAAGNMGTSDDHPASAIPSGDTGDVERSHKAKTASDGTIQHS